MREVIDHLETVALVMTRYALDEFKVDVVNALAIFKAINQIQRGTTDALDGRQTQLHRTGRHVDRLGPHVQRPCIRLVRVFDAKRQGTGTRAVLGGKVAGQAFGFAVHDEIDAALTVEHHIFGAVLGNACEAHCFEQGLEGVGRGGGELHKLKAHQPHGIVKKVCHVGLSCVCVGMCSL